MRDLHVAKDEGRSSRKTNSARVACVFLELERRTESGRAHFYPHQREVPLKSESLQNARRSVRYNRLRGAPEPAEGKSPLRPYEAFQSTFQREPRRASNSGLRGHCRVAGGPMAGARTPARPAIGGAAAARARAPPRPPSPARVRRPEPCGRTAAKVARERAGASAGARVRAGRSAGRLRHTTKIFSVMGRDSRVNLNTKWS